jgi:hypothetical protein
LDRIIAKLKANVCSLKNQKQKLKRDNVHLRKKKLKIIKKNEHLTRAVVVAWTASFVALLTY